MVLLKIAVDENRLIKVRDTLMIEDTLNGIECEFEFRSDWSSLDKEVIFGKGHIFPYIQDPETLPINLDENNKCTVPSLTISEEGTFSIGLVGTNDDTRIVTNWLFYQVNFGCYDAINPQRPPSPTPENMYIVEQINEHNLSPEAHANLFNSKADRINDTIVSDNADYAEIFQWYDNNPNFENRIGRFVVLDADTPGRTIKIANEFSDIVGVTVENPAFSGNAANKFDANGNLLTQYEFVAVHGIMPIIDNGTCTVKGRCIPSADGTAIPSTNDMGYFCMERVDATHMLIVVEPNADMLVRIKNDVIELNKNSYTIQKISDYLYYIDYNELDYINGINFCLNRFNPQIGACSAIHKGNFYGRNYDWYYDENATFIVNRKATKGKFANIGVATGLITNEMANSGEYSELYDYLPFITLDGINENGVVCNINILPKLDAKSHTTGTNPGKQDVPMACLVRCILDDASSADDAIYKIQNDYNIIAANSEYVSAETHFMIADATKTYVVEFVDNAPVIIEQFIDDKPIMTNFYLTDYNGTQESLTPYAMGIERYAILSAGFDNANTAEDMADLMKSVYYTKAYSATENPIWYSEFAGQYNTFGNLTKDSTPEEYAPLMEYVRKLFADRERDSSTWQTVHSSVYDIKNRKLHIKVQEEDISYVFSLHILGKDELEVSVQKIFYSYEDAVEYATTDLSAYVGQSITVVDADNDIVTVYVIVNSSMELSQIGGSSSIMDYNNVINKPQINGITLVGDKTSEDLDIDTVSMTNTEINNIFNNEVD